jgi:hypothetical protein
MRPSVTQLARYTLDDETEVSFEVDDSDGYTPAGLDDKVIGKLRDAAKPCVAAARTVLAMLEDSKPDEAEVTFSIKATGTTDWVVGKAATEGTLQVRLLWKAQTAG